MVLPNASPMEGVHTPLFIQNMSLLAVLVPEQKRRKRSSRLRSHGCEDLVEMMEDELGIVDAAVGLSKQGRNKIALSPELACGFPIAG